MFFDDIHVGLFWDTATSHSDPYGPVLDLPTQEDFTSLDRTGPFTRPRKTHQAVGVGKDSPKELKNFWACFRLSS